MKTIRTQAAYKAARTLALKRALRIIAAYKAVATRRGNEMVAAQVGA